MTDLLDVLGLLCLVVFAFIVWPPAALVVAGVALLFISWTLERRGDRE